MARTKRLVHHPDASTRPAVRRRTSDDQTPGPVNADLNEPPPISGEAPVISNVPDTGSSQRESPKAVSSSRVSDSGPTLFDDPILETDEEILKVQEEFQQRVSAIKKRREEMEMKRLEEERLKKEEEERLLKEEEERLRKEEEDRQNREEAERLAKEAEEKRLRDEEEQLRKEEEARMKKAEEDRLQADNAKLLAEAIEKAENERLRPVRQPTDTQGEIQEQIPADAIPHDTTDVDTAALPTATHSQNNPIKRALRNKGMVTRSVVTKSKRTPAKKPRKTAGKSTGIEPSFSSSSLETVDARNRDGNTPSKNPHQSTLGTEHAPSGVPRQFTTTAAAAHFESIRERKLNLERGFDPDFVKTQPFVKNRIIEQDWSMLAAANRRANASLVREFYAEASQSNEPCVKVRGISVPYHASAINQVLGMKTPVVCGFVRFLKKMTEADEELILKELAIEGKTWGRDGQRRCLHANTLTTEAAVWFQFLRVTISPTSHDTTLSMHKCALLYCVLTGKPINVGILMYAAIDQARTRKKVNLPLPCLITSLLISAGVPAAEEDQWLDSTSNICEGTIKKMGRKITVPNKVPTVRIADEHVEGAAGTPRQQPHAGEASSSAPNPMTAILQAISALTYKVDLLTTQQRLMNRSHESYWMYARDRDAVVNQMLQGHDPELFEQLPEFPEGICPNRDGGDDLEDDYEEDSGEDSGDSTPKDTPSH